MWRPVRVLKQLSNVSYPCRSGLSFCVLPGGLHLITKGSAARQHALHTSASHIPDLVCFNI